VRPLRVLLFAVLAVTALLLQVSVFGLLPLPQARPDVLLVVVVGGISLVGGRGSVLSVVAGTALIGVMLNGMTILNMNTHEQDIVKGLILLAALVLDNRLHPRDEETVRQGD
jgi:ribose/xylose/arabinose/galactoside ABC-type transport system permease subunit